MIHALLDVSACSALELDGILWAPLVAQLAAIIVDQDTSPHSRSCSRHCLMNILLASKSERPVYLRILDVEVKSSPKRKPTNELIALVIWLEKQFGSDANEVVSGVLDAGLSSSIDCVGAEGNQVHDLEFLRLLGKYVSFASRCVFMSLVQLYLSDRPLVRSPT